MKQFQPSEIQEFLEAVDSYLKSSFDLVIIGGAAATLAYKALKTTTDIDTANQIPDELKNAIIEAARKSGLDIPVTQAGVFDPPYYYEDRLQQYDEINLGLLKIYVPEQHDLALMKIVRGYENDIQTILEIHKKTPFCYETLVERFVNEMTQVIGNTNSIRLNFLLTIDTLFGDEFASQAEVLTENWPN